MLFFAREGYFFESILRELERREDIVVNFRYEVIAISRKSTFLPSINENDELEWMRYSNQYGGQPLAAFFSALDITPEECEQLFGELPNLRLDESLIEQDMACKQLFHSDLFKKIVGEKAATSRYALKAYLAEHGVADMDTEIAVVDIGWRGTIQDNLCYLYPHIKFVGYYFGLIPALNNQPKNAQKFGFINRFHSRAMLLKSHTQLEMLCSCEKGSVTGYRITNGKVELLVEDNSNDLYSWENYAKDFQRGVLEAPYAGQINDRTIWKAILPMTLYPDEKMAEAFFEFRYSERFGLGKFMDMQEVNISEEVFNILPIRKSYFKDLRAALNKTMWPQGYLRVRGKMIYLHLFNVLLFGVVWKEKRRFSEINEANN